jgi:hypothetical protein
MPENVVVVDQKPLPQGGVDPNISVPRAVREAAERADAHYGAPTVEGTPQAAAQGGNINIVEAQQQQPLQPHQPQQQQPQQPATIQDWERNFRSMKGRYDKAEQVNRELGQRLNQMAQDLIKTQTTLQEVTQAPKPVQQHRLLTDEEIRDYGPDFLDVVKKAAKEDIAPVVVALQQQIQEEKQKSHQASLQALYATLDAHIPNWRIINQSPRFISWLRLQDPYSGGIRQALLNDAFRSANAHRVARFFQGFIQDEAATGSAEPAQAQGTPQPSEAAQRQNAMTLDSLAAPGRARATPDIPQSADSRKPTYTHRQIATFYDNVRKEYYRGRDAEKNAIEADIFAAQREGRVK